MFDIGFKRGKTPVHGVDYLLNYYYILGDDKTKDPLPRDASPEQIREAYRTLMRSYHPDKVSALGEDYKKVSNDKVTMINLAYHTLIDSEKRAKYDEKLDGFHPDFISKDGTPIINMRDKRVDVDFLAGGGVWENKEDMLREAKKKYGYNEDLFRIIEDGYLNTENPSPEMKGAYIDVLKKKVAYLGVKESILWDSAGVGNQEMVKGFYFDDMYLEIRKNNIEEVKKDIAGNVNEILLALTAGESPRLLIGPDEAIDSEYAQENTEELRRKLIDISTNTFEASVPELESTAKELAEELYKLASMTEWEYCPPDQKVFRKLLVLIGIDGIIGGQIPTEFDESGNNAETIDEKYDIGDDPRVETIKSIVNTSTGPIYDIIDSGMNVALLYLTEGIDIEAQLMAVVRTHAGKVHERYSNTLQGE